MKGKVFIYVTEVVLSLMVVCGLFWVAFFVKPTVHVDKIERFAFERRDSFYSIVVLDDKGQSVCAVGNYGKIVRTDDGGATWKIQKTPVRTNLQKVAAWDRKSLVAIGDKNTVLVTGDAGQNWKKVEIPSSKFGDQLLSATIDPESGRAWIVGNSGTVFVSDDRGGTWSRAHPEEDVSWNDVTVAPDHKIWIVGEFGRVKYSGDEGKSWEEVSVPTESSLNAIAFSDASHGAIVGLSGTILVTADGGQSWQAAESGVQSHLYEVLWDGQSYRAIGDAGMILTAGAEGLDWKVGKLGPHNYAWYTGIARAGNSYFICGAGAGVYSEGKWTPFEPGRRTYKRGSVDNG